MVVAVLPSVELGKFVVVTPGPAVVVVEVPGAADVVVCDGADVLEVLGATVVVTPGAAVVVVEVPGAAVVVVVGAVVEVVVPGATVVVVVEVPGAAVVVVVVGATVVVVGAAVVVVGAVVGAAVVVVVVGGTTTVEGEVGGGAAVTPDAPVGALKQVYGEFAPHIPQYPFTSPAIPFCFHGSLNAANKQHPMLLAAHKFVICWFTAIWFAKFATPHCCPLYTFAVEMISGPLLPGHPNSVRITGFVATFLSSFTLNNV